MSLPTMPALATMSGLASMVVPSTSSSAAPAVASSAASSVAPNVVAPIVLAPNVVAGAGATVPYCPPGIFFFNGDGTFMAIDYLEDLFVWESYMALYGIWGVFDMVVSQIY